MFQAYQHYFNQKNRDAPGNFVIASSSAANLQNPNPRRGYRPITASVKESSQPRGSSKLHTANVFSAGISHQKTDSLSRAIDLQKN
jgi:hypothetical protein